jgi:hypothetical protein
MIELTLPSEYDFGLKELKLNRILFAGDFDQDGHKWISEFYIFSLGLY